VAIFKGDKGVMEVSELRIGNTVQVTGGFEQPYFSEVVAIFEDTIRLDNQKFESYNQAWCIVDYDIEEIFGLPLTEKILLACGFVKCEGKFGEYFKCSKLDGFRIWLTEYNNYSWWSIGRKDYESDETVFIFKDCKHLHQLQNLYFALTNQGLDVKL